MHEMSVAHRICEIAEERLGSTRLGELIAIGVDVGDDAGLEPENLAFCLDALLAQPPFHAARAEITRCAGDVLRLTYLEIDDDR
jgi:Zn finger protein HypA/HybF involved in hydrogenase expression